MKLGTMNNPRNDITHEARRAAEQGFEFLDLTVEGPGAAIEQIDVAELRTILTSTGLDVVGHTAWYLPFASPIRRIRQAAIETVVETFETFAALGATWVNVHVSRTPSLFPRSDMLHWNRESFAELAERAAPYGLGIMVENMPDEMRVNEFQSILEGDERIGFHLDIGHANVGKDRLEGFLKALRKRLAHVHMSDNMRQSDDHLPLGVGAIDWPRAIHLLKAIGYDGTITLEVFSPDYDYLLMSAQKVRAWWNGDSAS
jgi:sugar phosphate isomerase/epimerase